MKPQTRVKKVQVVLRIPEDLALRIDTYVSKLAETNSGFNFSRSDVMRHLLEKGMVKVDEESVEDAG
jgi:hypothetical protein